MTPQEKANKLIKKLKDYCFHNSDNDAEEQRIYNAKQCALVCVDEILDHVEEIRTFEYHFGKSIAYWRDVKDEINKP